MTHFIIPDTVSLFREFYTSTARASERFAKAMVPTLPYPAWMNPFRPGHDGKATLQAIATLYGLSSYSEMTVNTYGQNTLIGEERPPLPEPLDAQLVPLAESMIADWLNETTPHGIASILYGDEIMATQGYPGLGLPPFAGIEIAHLRVYGET